MRDREAFKLKSLAVVHNLFMFSLSLWMVIETLSQVSPARSDKYVAKLQCSTHL